MSRSILRFYKSKMILVEISIKWRKLSCIYCKKYCTDREKIIGLTLNIYLQVTLHPPHISMYMSGIYIRICSTFMICCAITILVKRWIIYLAFDKSGNLINYFWYIKVLFHKLVNVPKCFYRKITIQRWRRMLNSKKTTKKIPWWHFVVLWNILLRFIII